MTSRNAQLITVAAWPNGYRIAMYRYACGHEVRLPIKPRQKAGKLWTKPCVDCAARALAADRETTEE